MKRFLQVFSMVILPAAFFASAQQGTDKYQSGTPYPAGTGTNTNPGSGTQNSTNTQFNPSMPSGVKSDSGIGTISQPPPPPVPAVPSFEGDSTGARDFSDTVIAPYSPDTLK